MKSLAGWVSADDGAFWMSWQDFTRNFDELYVCRFYDRTTFPCQGSWNGQWDSRTAGGCCNHPTVDRNVQLALTLLDDGGGGGAGDVELAVELIQADCRGSGSELPLVILELYDNDGQPVTQRKRGRLLANRGSNTLALHIQLTLSAQQVQRSLHAPLTLLPCTYQPGTLTSYTLRWFASATVHVQRYGDAGSQLDVDAANSSRTAHSAGSEQPKQPHAKQRVLDDGAAAQSTTDSSAAAEKQSQTADETVSARSSFTIAASRPASPAAKQLDTKATRAFRNKQRLGRAGKKRITQVHPVEETHVTPPGRTDDFEL